jgi:hypothetical protein
MAAAAKPVPNTAEKRVAAAAKKALKDPAPADQTASQAAAHAIGVEFPDLEPSLMRIMTSDLDEDARLIAITLFRESLGMIGNPNRVPANAIAEARRRTS